MTDKTSTVPDRIERAAIAIFSRQGYNGTSTREIARLADVSEVTLFRYFENKETIFLTALCSSLSSIKPRLELIDRVAERRTPEETLPEILRLLVDIVTFSPELLRMVAVAILELRGKAKDVCYEELTPLFTTINRYLTKNIETGKIRNLNPAIVTAAMTLSVIAQPELSNLIEGCRHSQLSSRETIDEWSKFWLNVLAPRVPEQVNALSRTLESSRCA